jgi:hypothetical protein
MKRLSSAGSIRRDRRRFPLFPAVYAASCGAGALALVMLPGAGPAAASSRIVSSLMAVTALVLFLVPLLSAHAGSAIRDLVPSVSLAPMSRCLPRLMLLRLGPLLRTAGIVSLAPCAAVLAASRLSGAIPVSNVLQACAVILAVALCALAAGFYCAIVFEDAPTAAGTAILIAFLVSTEPIWLGPVIRSVSDASWMIRPSLLANPFVGVASALDFDVFRIDPFYHICPIGQLRFSYPAWHGVVLTALLISSVLVWRSVARVRRLAMPSG